MRLTFNIGTENGNVSPLGSDDHSKLGTAQKAHFFLSRINHLSPGIVSGFSFREELGEYDGKPEETIVVTIDFERWGSTKHLIDMIANWGKDLASNACGYFRQECISWKLLTPGIHADRFGLEYNVEISEDEHLIFSPDLFIN